MANKQSEFWSKGASKYDRIIDLQIGPKMRSMVWERLAQESHLGNAAEFGCGTGYYTQFSRKRADSVVATDISPGMLEIAKNRVHAAT